MPKVFRYVGVEAMLSASTKCIERFQSDITSFFRGDTGPSGFGDTKKVEERHT